MWSSMTATTVYEGSMRGRVHSHPSDAAIGIAIATIGTLILLARLHLLHFAVNLPDGLITWWPLLLISWGLIVLALPRNARRS